MRALISGPIWGRVLPAFTGSPQPFFVCKYTELTPLLGSQGLPASPSLETGTGLRSNLKGNSHWEGVHRALAPDSSIFDAYQSYYKQSGPWDSSMRALALSLLLLTVLNGLSLKSQLWEEILAPTLKGGGGAHNYLKYWVSCSSEKDNIFQKKNVKMRDTFSGIFLWPQAGGWRLEGWPFQASWVPPPPWLAAFSLLDFSSMVRNSFLVYEEREGMLQLSLICLKDIILFWNICLQLDTTELK